MACRRDCRERPIEVESIYRDENAEDTSSLALDRKRRRRARTSPDVPFAIVSNPTLSLRGNNGEYVRVHNERRDAPTSRRDRREWR